MSEFGHDPPGRSEEPSGQEAGDVGHLASLATERRHTRRGVAGDTDRHDSPRGIAGRMNFAAALRLRLMTRAAKPLTSAVPTPTSPRPPAYQRPPASQTEP